MRLRSLLFVPGDSERKFARARDCGADALILDLEDSVAAVRKGQRPRPCRRSDRARGETGLDVHRARQCARHRARARRPRGGREARPRRALDPQGQRRGRSRAHRPLPRRARGESRHGRGLSQIGERGDRNREGDVRAWLVCASASAADRLDLGRGGPLGGARRDRQQGAGRIVDLSVSVRARARACSRPPPPRSRPSIRSIRIFAMPRGSSGIAGAPGATVSSGASRSIPIRSPRSTALMRHPKPRSRMRARSSPHSRPIRARARLGWTARWSTFRI